MHVTENWRFPKIGIIVFFISGMSFLASLSYEENSVKREAILIFSTPVG